MNSKFRVLLSCLALSLFSAPVCAQLKHEALVVPVYFTGVKDTSSQRILQQHVLTELSQSFELRSEQEVAQAREKAADKLASDNCNEVACLKVMGELLDVDYLFAIGITASGSYWDLTGVRLDPLGRTVRRSVECPDCTLSKARAGLTKLLRGLHPGKAKVEQGKAILILESQPNGIVFLEGIEQGETPIELSLPSDRPAEILVFAEGYQDYSNFFDLKPGERRTEQIRLVKRRGRVRITSNPSGAAIFLDDQPLRDASGREQSTPAEARLEYGKHMLRLTFDKYRDIKDLIANKRVSRHGVFPFRFRGSCRLEPCFDGEVAPEIMQSAGGFDEGVLKAGLEVAINVTDATEDLDSGDTVLDAHPYLGDTPIGLLLCGAEFAPLRFLLCLQSRDPCGFIALKTGVLPEP